MSFIDCERVAEDVLHRSGAPRLENGIAIDVERIIRRRHDIDVARVEDLFFSGQKLAGLFSPAHLAVVVEANDLLVRQRFTMAHELGHIEIHYKGTGSPTLFEVQAASTSYRCTEQDITTELDMHSGVADAKRRLREVIANRFAAALLMPKGLVREMWRKTPNIFECSNALRVSTQAMTIRLEHIAKS